MTIDLGPVRACGDLAADGPDAAEVGAAVVPLRRPDGDEDDLGLGDPLGQVGRERQPAVAEVAVDQLGQARLVDRHLALLEPLDLGGDLVDADHVVAALGQAGPLTRPTYPVPTTAIFTSLLPPSFGRMPRQGDPTLPAGSARAQLSGMPAPGGKHKWHAGITRPRGP